MVLMGWSHRRLALFEYGVMAAAGISGLVLLQYPLMQSVILLVWCLFYFALAVVIDRRWKESGLAY
jgi:hypothetical protein